MIWLISLLLLFQPPCPPRCVTPQPFTPEVTRVRVTSTPTATPRPTKTVTPTVEATKEPEWVLWLPVVFK